MRALQLLAAAFFVLFGATAAYAGGDLTDYTPPPRPVSACGGPFSGFYAGGILGLGGSSTKTDLGGLTLKDNDKEFTGGGIAGYNWQCNGTLLGVESDISYLGADMQTGVLCPGCGPGGANSSLSFGSDINWFGTLRARVGLAGDENFLIFATGGLAYGGVDHSLDSVNGATNIPGEGLNFSGSKSSTEIGWTVGGGLEYLLSDRWSFRADALYVDFGSTDETFTASASDGCTATVCRARIGYDDSFWVARVGLSYLFNSAPSVPADPYVDPYPVPEIPEYRPIK